MSLLEDIFLQDEANEARELERVIEGDDYDERPRSISPSGDESDNSRKDDEAEEDKRRVDPSSNKTKKAVKNPRFILNPARLTGPRGIQVIPEHFKDFKFKGKGYEKEDLDMVLKKLEHWAYRLYPKFRFEDCLKKIETLGKKRPVMVHLHKIRTDQFLSEETVVQKDSSDDETPQQEEDEFDKLLQQQIELARATPAPGSVKKTSNEQWQRVMENSQSDRSHIMMPKATSSPSISDEQRERMLKNRKLAEERRLARLKQAMNDNSLNSNTSVHIAKNISKHNITENEDNINNDNVSKKSNRANVIDSSDSEDETHIQTKVSIEVDIHMNTDKSKSVINDDIIENKEKSDAELMIIDDEENNKNEKVSSYTKNNEGERSIEDVMEIEKRSKKIEVSKNNAIEIGNVATEIEENNIVGNKINETDIAVMNNEIETEPDIGEVDKEINTDEKKTDMTDKNNSEIDNNFKNTSRLDENLESTKLSNKEGINDFTEEMMDVDFSEEF